jgi:hypothetical protein
MYTYAGIGVAVLLVIALIKMKWPHKFDWLQRVNGWMSYIDARLRRIWKGIQITEDSRCKHYATGHIVGGQLGRKFYVTVIIVQAVLMIVPYVYLEYPKYAERIDRTRFAITGNEGYIKKYVVTQSVEAATSTVAVAIEAKEPLKIEDRIPALLKKICKAESAHGHIDPQTKHTILNYNPKSDSYDAGACQINLSAHGPEAKRRGYDLMTKEGNIGYAIELFYEEGATPWLASKSRWSR